MSKMPFLLVLRLAGPRSSRLGCNPAGYLPNSRFRPIGPLGLVAQPTAGA